MIEGVVEAINKFERAYKSGFEPAETVVLKLAESYLKNEEYEKSVRYYEKLIDLTPENFDAFIKAIWLHLDFLKNEARAIELAKRAVKLHPNNALSYNLLGWAETQNGELENAKANLEKALEIDENLAAAYLNLGIWYETQGNLPEAKANYFRAYNLEKATGVGQKAGEKYNALVKQEATSTLPPTP